MNLDIRTMELKDGRIAVYFLNDLNATNVVRCLIGIYGRNSVELQDTAKINRKFYTADKL